MKKIVFPEIEDGRVQQAVMQLVRDEVCTPVVIRKGGAERSVTLAGVEIVDPQEIETIPDVDTTGLDESLVVGATLVATGKADGIVSGAVATTADVFRVYKKIIGLADGVSRASSCFLMERGAEKYIFADCAINISPDAATLSEIAYASDKFAKMYGLESRVAFLSFATGQSASDTSVEKIREAVKLTKQRWPDVVCDGPLQVDSALVPAVFECKAPDSILRGQATVLIFPDINSGNIAYKLTERLGGFQATGPLLLGFAKPAHDLSRGCSVEDIVSAAKIAVLEAQRT